MALELNNKKSFGAAYYRRYSGNIFRPLFGVKPGIIKMIRRMVPGGRLFDVGCGMGHFLQAAARHYQVCGMEGSEYAASQAGRLTGLDGRVMVGNAEKELPLKDGSCDIITALDVVEHLSRPENFIHEAHRLLKPGGLLVISTPNPDSIGKTIKNKQWSGYRDPTHVNILPTEGWENLMKDEFDLKRTFYDGLWDSPYFLRNGFWALPVIRALVGLTQSLLIVLPFIVLNSLGFGSSRRLGENLWIFACKKDEK